MEPTPVSLPWLDIVKLALGTGFVAAAINQGASWIREWRKEAKATKRDATYLALRVAVTLERFALDGAALISDSQTYDETSGGFGNIHYTLPDLLPYPKDVDWKSIDTNLASRALSFRNELWISVRYLKGCFDLGIDHAADECSKKAGLHGYRAWQLAADMRRRYALPDFDPLETAWDLVSLLKGQHDKELSELAILNR